MNPLIKSHLPLAASIILACAAGAGADPALTIYNQNFAVVRDAVPLDLKQGQNDVSFTNTAAHLEPWNQYRGYNMENSRNYENLGSESETKVAAVREFKNSVANHLGMPLSKGRVRFYKQGSDQQMEFTGENTIDHTPKDETLRIYTGNAFDLVGERIRTNFHRTDHTVDETYEITLRNHKTEPAGIRVVEHLFRWTNWEITAKSDAFSKTNAQTVEFRVPLKPDEEKKLSYTVHYSW